MAMIATPFGFEPKLSNQEFEKLGRFACRWSHIEHIIGNCLRRLLNFDPKQATAMIFPLSLDIRMSRIGELVKLKPLSPEQMVLFEELKPLIRAIQYLRNTVLHGIVIDLSEDDDIFFQLRSRNRNITKAELFSCEDLINYAAHVCLSFRHTMGEKDDDPRGSNYALPDRPPIPSFLPDDCRAFPKENRATS